MQKRPAIAVRRSAEASLPPASPHRAGHYFGLHPEDQPYQSNKLMVRRPLPSETERWSQQEPEGIIFPSTEETPALKIYRKEVRSASISPKPQAARELVSSPAYLQRRPFLPASAVSLLLAISCIVFLLASSIIAFTLIRSHTEATTASIQATPSSVQIGATFMLKGSGFGARDLMTFTYDHNELVLDHDSQPLEIHTSAPGTFAVPIVVPANWEIGVHTINVVDNAQGVSLPIKITVHN